MCREPWFPVASPALVRVQRPQVMAPVFTQRRSEAPTRIPAPGRSESGGGEAAPAARAASPGATAAAAARPHSQPAPELPLAALLVAAAEARAARAWGSVCRVVLSRPTPWPGVLLPPLVDPAGGRAGGWGGEGGR